MELILHFSVHYANIRVFCETTKFLEEFLLHILISRRSRKVYHQYSVLTIYQWVRHISIFSFKLAFVSTVTTVSNDRGSNGGSILVGIINFSTPLSPSCEEGGLNPLPSPRPFQKGKGCNRSSCRSLPLRYKVGGASEPSPGFLCGCINFLKTYLFVIFF